MRKLKNQYRKLNKLQNIACVVNIIGILCLVGTVGSLELDLISTNQFLWQSFWNLISMFLCVMCINYLEKQRKYIKHKIKRTHTV